MDDSGELSDPGLVKRNWFPDKPGLDDCQLNVMGDCLVDDFHDSTTRNNLLDLIGQLLPK